MRATHNRGVTIMELLVTLGIILLLISILIPAASALRRRSKVTQCASNLRQIGQALLTYRAELRRWPEASLIPAPFTPPDWPGSTRPLPETIHSYLSPRSGVYRCPGDDEIFEQCASQVNGVGISYIYLLPVYERPASSDTIMLDFQGYSAPLWRVEVREFHRPRRGMNMLKTDGSVEFDWGNPAPR